MPHIEHRSFVGDVTALHVFDVYSGHRDLPSQHTAAGPCSLMATRIVFVESHSQQSCLCRLGLTAANPSHRNWQAELEVHSATGRRSRAWHTFVTTP